jgi:hypothetical protein
MMAASINHVGMNTGKMIFVSLKEGDNDVKFLKGELDKNER